MKKPTQEQLIEFYTDCLNQAKAMTTDIYKGYNIPYPDSTDLIERSTNAYFVLCKEIEKVNGGWSPNFDDTSEIKYYPYMRLREDDQQFRFVLSLYVNSHSSVSARMCFKTSELCEKFVEENLDLYKEWMLSK